MKIRNLLTSAILAAVITPAAQAASILGGSLFVDADGSVTATFLGGSAAYADLLFLDADSDTYIFHNHLTPLNTSVSLGTFTAGTELIFRIDVYQGGDTDKVIDHSYFTGDGSRNPDGIAHALINTDNPDVTLVGFEDIYNGGDKDYNDITYSFSNLRATQTSVPEPSSLALLSAGLLGVGIARRRNRKA